MDWRSLIEINFPVSCRPALIADLDWNPPEQFIEILSEKTRVDPARIRQMTVAGWCPLLIDPVEHLEEKYTTYTCQYEIFIKTSWRKTWLNRNNRRPASGSWNPWIHTDDFWSRNQVRACPECLKENRYLKLHWMLGWMVTCPIHSSPLEQLAFTADLKHFFLHKPDREVAALPAVYALDSLTLQAVTGGKVTLADDKVLGAGVWLRWLRGLLDELTAPVSVTKRFTDLIGRFWEEGASRPDSRYGRRWRPLEEMPDVEQREVMNVAAVAVEHLRTNQCVAAGADGTLLNTPSTIAGDLPSIWSPRLSKWILPPDPFVDPNRKLTPDQRLSRSAREHQHILDCIVSEWRKSPLKVIEWRNALIVMAKGDPAREKVEIDVLYRHLAELGIPPPVEPDSPVT
jgi:TniQ